MRARLDWRLAAVAMAVALLASLVVLVVERPLGIDVLARDRSSTSSECDESDSSSESEGGSGSSSLRQNSSDDEDEDDDDEDQSQGSSDDDGQDDDSASSSSDSDSDSDSGSSGSGGQQASDDCEDQDSGSSGSSGSDGGDSDGGSDGGDSDGGSDDGDSDGGDGGDDEEFPGRDEIGAAPDDQYVNIESVESNSGLNLGGDFSGGSYTIECDLSDHHNSDNHIIAPGVRNGAQHTHDYAGNTTTNFASDEQTLAEGDTTCSNGDQSPIFWPVLRDLNGTGPDVGVDGGSLDGNVGSFIVPDIDITFHGHGTRRTEPMPLNMILVTGAAKAATDDGEGSNAKFSCTGFEDRVTDLYPLCPDGSNLQRVYDFPSCWNGRDLDSEDKVSHITYPDDAGECDDDLIPVPALRITLTYDQPAGRNFAIDSFPEQQHDPITDHALLEYLSSERRAQEGADCINNAEQCVQGSETNVSAASTDPRDEVATSVTFASAFATHHRVGTHDRDGHGASAATGNDDGASAATGDHDGASAATGDHGGGPADHASLGVAPLSALSGLRRIG